MKIKDLLFTLVLLMILIACSSPQERSYQRVGNEEFSTFIDNPEVLLIDIRTDAETSKGIIEGALLIDFFSPDFTSQIEQLDRNAPIAIYCASGGRSAKAASQLQSLNFKEIVELKVGFNGWKAAGYPVKEN
ncbi:MAG: rhodanese-like domain-containing protein [Cyclobacteriaceae bacterium]